MDNVKALIIRLLLERDYASIVDLCEQDRRSWKTLRSSLHEVDENVRWPAIEAVATLMQRWWEKGRRETVYEYIRRLFWSINDESGEIGWSAPQTIAETILRIPELSEPFSRMLICLSLEEPALLKGSLWAAGRLGQRISAIAAFSQKELMAAFNDNDPQTLALAAWAVGEIGFKPALPLLYALLNREEQISIYFEGQFYTKTLAEWASASAASIKAAPGAISYKPV